MCVCQNVQNHKYHTGEAFLEDVQLMHNNSMAYNGKDSTLTRTSLRMLQQCEEMIQEVRSPALDVSMFCIFTILLSALECYSSLRCVTGDEISKQ